MSPLVGSGVWFGSGSGGKGVFSLGYPNPTTNIYTYSSNGVATGTNLTANLYLGAAAGNSTLGIFAIGNATTTTNIYTYSSNGVATGTNLTADLNAGAATSTYPGGF